MRVMTDTEVQEALSWREVLEALEAAFRQIHTYKMPERLAIEAPGGGSYLTMPCADAEGWFGVKQVAVVPENAERGKPTVQAHYTLFDPTGTPCLSAAATVLTRIRTAGVSALAASFLAPEDARTLLVIGTGSLAPFMAEAHAQVRAYERVLVWGRNPESAEGTARELRERLPDLKVHVANDLNTALSEADVVSAATTARAPLVRGASLRGAQHVDLVGAFTPDMFEADADAVMRAEVFVDDLEAAEAEAGDLLRACEAGWSFGRVRGTLGDVVTSHVGWGSAQAVTLFKSVGLALEDLEVAKRLVQMPQWPYEGHS